MDNFNFVSGALILLVVIGIAIILKKKGVWSWSTFIKPHRHSVGREIVMNLQYNLENLRLMAYDQCEGYTRTFVDPEYVKHIKSQGGLQPVPLDAYFHHNYPKVRWIVRYENYKDTDHQGNPVIVPEDLKGVLGFSEEFYLIMIDEPWFRGKKYYAG